MGIDFNNSNVVYFAGLSNLPVNTTVGQVYKNMAVGVIIDLSTGQILDANVTLVSPLASEFVKAQIIGRNFEKDLERIIKDIERYQAPAQKPIIVALKAAFDRYKNYINNLKEIGI